MFKWCLSIIMEGLAMTQVVIRRPLTSETRAQSRLCLCGTSFSLSTSVFCHCHSTNAPPVLIFMLLLLESCVGEA